MEVSTFELLVKRIAPVPPTDPAVARRVVQGYFLTITNLEDEDFLYQLDFHISQPNPADPDRTLAGNAQAIIDIAGANTALSLSPASATNNTTRFTTRFRLPAKQTASVQLLPILTPALLNQANPDLEVRGFVSLRLPAVFNFTPVFPQQPPIIPPRPFFRPQSNSPVKVLLNPEVRGTFLPNGFPPAGGDFDQINSSIALASGQGLNEIEPDRFPILTIPSVQVPELVESLTQRQQPSLDVSALTSAEQAEALVDLLSQVEPTADNLQNISDVLSKLNIPVQMTPVS